MKLENYKEFIYKDIRESKEDLINDICKRYGIKNYTINLDGSIDVDGDVNFYNLGLKKIPIKFNKVLGDFQCGYNNLTTLKGSPKEVEGSFNCERNKLKTLEGSPIKVSRFNCSHNKLTTLKGSPSKVDGVFHCTDNHLSKLKGAPKEVNSFNFNDNKIRDFYGLDSIFYKINVIANPVFELISLFPSDRRWEAIQLLNEYEVIRDGKIIILQALELVYDDMNLEVPYNFLESDKVIKHYEIR